MEIGDRRVIVVLSAVVVILLGVAAAWYMTENNRTNMDAPTQTFQAVAPTTEERVEVYETLQTDSSAETSSVPQDEREKILEETRDSQNTQMETSPAPSTSDREKLLESLGD